MRGRIPKASKKSLSKSYIPKYKQEEKKEGIVFSFETLEKNEYFNLDGTCVNWPAELFDMLHDVSRIPKIDLISGNYTKYRVHDHESAKPPVPMPEGISQKDCYQIRISKSKGGIHGIFIDNVFYVIWLDPLHNMYPNDRYGGLRKVKPYSTCCKDRDEEIVQLKKENEELLNQNKKLNEDIDSLLEK